MSTRASLLKRFDELTKFGPNCGFKPSRDELDEIAEKTREAIP